MLSKLDPEIRILAGRVPILGQNPASLTRAATAHMLGGLMRMYEP